MSEIDSGTPDQSPGLKVVVAKMPDKPAKPLIRDPNRLIAIAAFVFSVSTGVFATYNTWRSSRATIVDNVSKLTDQYYDGQAKMAQLNPSQVGYVNLLRTTLRSTALRAINQASLVKPEIDDGTWLALAQINDNENNLAASELAWRAATDVTKDLSIYLFGLRGLAANKLRQDDLAGAAEVFTTAINASLAEKFRDQNNRYSVDYRNIEAAATEAVWLTGVKVPDCAFITRHFDNSLRYIGEAHRTTRPGDYGYISELVTTRINLGYFRKVRLACAQPADELVSSDDCLALGEVLENASFGFFSYRGPAVSNDSNPDVWALYYLPDVERCTIGSAPDFSCVWPENGEADTAARAAALVNKLMACKNFKEIKKAVTTRETKSRIAEVTYLSSIGNPLIRITRSHWKANDGSLTDWDVSLVVEKP